VCGYRLGGDSVCGWVRGVWLQYTGRGFSVWLGGGGGVLKEKKNSDVKNVHVRIFKRSCSNET
jgi:hypothetical protein